jgi:hypothetical protein
MLKQVQHDISGLGKRNSRKVVSVRVVIRQTKELEKVERMVLI